MDDNRLDMIFGVMNRNLPRAPSELVEQMVQTVNKLEAERGRRTDVDPAVPEAPSKAQLEKAPKPEAKPPRGMGM